jgi:hypothetical protein
MKKLLIAAVVALGLAIPAEAIAHHTPGASYTGTYSGRDSSGSVAFSITGDLCAQATKKVKKLRRAYAANPSPKLKKKLKAAKIEKKYQCGPPLVLGGTATGERVKSFTFTGPVTGRIVTRPTDPPGDPCPILGPGIYQAFQNPKFVPAIYDLNNSPDDRGHAFTFEGEFVNAGTGNFDDDPEADGSGNFDGGFGSLNLFLATGDGIGCQASLIWNATKR